MNCGRRTENERKSHNENERSFNYADTKPAMPHSTYYKSRHTFSGHNHRRSVPFLFIFLLILFFFHKFITIYFALGAFVLGRRRQGEGEVERGKRGKGGGVGVR